MNWAKSRDASFATMVMKQYKGHLTLLRMQLMKQIKIQKKSSQST